MKRLSDSAIRQALIASGSVDTHKKPEPAQRTKMHPKLSRVNAIIQRRKMFVNTHA